MSVPLAVHGSGLGETRILAERDLKRAFAPESVIGTVVMPLLFLGMFYLTLHELLKAKGIDFGRYVIPTVVVQSLMFIAISAANRVAEDRRSGLLGRWRGMPIPNRAVGTSLALVVGAEAAVATVAVTAVGYLFGFRFDGGPVSAIAFLLVSVLFGVAVASVTATIGLTMRSPENMAAVLNLPYLPLLMLSTGFVPAELFPGWLQPVVNGSPVSAAVNGLRAVAGESPDLSRLWPAVLWSVGLLTVFLYASAKAFRKVS